MEVEAKKPSPSNTIIVRYRVDRVAAGLVLAVTAEGQRVAFNLNEFGWTPAPGDEFACITTLQLVNPAPRPESEQK